MTTRKEQVAALVAAGRHLDARRLVLGGDVGASYARGEELPSAAAPTTAAAPAAPPVANPPGAFSVRAEVNRLTATGNARDNLLARVAIMTASPEAYCDGIRAERDAKVAQAQQEEAALAQLDAEARAQARAEIAKELGVASIEDAKRLAAAGSGR